MSSLDSGKPVLIEWGERFPDCSLPRSRRSGWSISEKIPGRITVSYA